MTEFITADMEAKTRVKMVKISVSGTTAASIGVEGKFMQTILSSANSSEEHKFSAFSSHLFQYTVTVCRVGGIDWPRVCLDLTDCDSPIFRTLSPLQLMLSQTA